MTKFRVRRHMAIMVNGGAKPNRRIEQLLHHGPVTAILDKTLIDEIRQLGDGTGKTVAEAHRTAMRMSLRLQTIATSRADRT